MQSDTHESIVRVDVSNGSNDEQLNDNSEFAKRTDKSTQKTKGSDRKSECLLKDIVESSEKTLVTESTSAYSQDIHDAEEFESRLSSSQWSTVQKGTRSTTKGDKEQKKFSGDGVKCLGKTEGVYSESVVESSAQRVSVPKGSIVENSSQWDKKNQDIKNSQLKLLKAENIAESGIISGSGEEWSVKFSKKDSKRNKKSQTFESDATVKAIDVSHASTVGEGKASQELSSKYLQQGARPKVRSHTQSISVGLPIGNANSKDVSQKKNVSLSTVNVSEMKAHSCMVTGIGTGVHLETKPIGRSGDTYGCVTNKQYLASVDKFKMSVEKFAKMHMQYIANIVFDVFAIENGNIIFRDEIQNVLLKTTKNIELCSFVIKQGIIMQVMSRVCSSKLYNSVMYCASHWDNQKILDAVLLEILNLGPNALVSMLPSMRNVFLNMHEGIEHNVFRLYSGGFYSGLLNMCYDFITQIDKSPGLMRLYNFIILSSQIHFGTMYDVICKSQVTAAGVQNVEAIKKLIFNGHRVGSVQICPTIFVHRCCGVKRTFRHLYSPNYKNVACTIGNLNIPSVIIKECSCNIDEKVAQCIEEKTMSFDVFVEDMVCNCVKSLLYQNVKLLLEKDIALYEKEVRSKYQTMGSTTSSRML
ncbi:DUF3514 domain-containing protein [Ehrlichia canis]|uniref:Uncharacterized protein n=1 Tax=Ehrlichia canis (strain Jake) TaxID=269484 RepID=A0ACA6AV49_EHRCJ|nr:DUF3514 domain-containing protein [Ehrlichia canis]AAZ68122.1 hypothetical protein Ecaj_0071 [Ehrlichia canis str. Jake]